jgi:hypothetical protein
MWKSSMTMQKPVKKEKMVEEKKEKIIENLVLQTILNHSLLSNAS